MIPKGIIKKDFWLPSVLAILVVIISMNVLPYLDCKRIYDLSATIASIATDYGMTFSGFFITAFSFIQILSSRRLYNQISKTKPFGSFVSSFYFSIVLNLVILLVSVVFKIVIAFNICCVDELFLIIMPAILVFSIVWVFRCTKMLFKLITDLE